MDNIRGIWQHAHHMLRSARKMINDNLDSLDLGSAEGNILLHLLTQGKEMTQDQLVDQLDISKPAVSNALDSLEAKGYVTRQQASNDRRVHKVSLTPLAQEIAPAIEKAYNQLYTIAMQGITPEELDVFLSLFNRISENLMNAQTSKSTEAKRAA